MKTEAQITYCGSSSHYSLCSDLEKGEQMREDLVVSNEKYQKMYEDMFDKQRILIRDRNKLQEKVEALDEEVSNLDIWEGWGGELLRAIGDEDGSQVIGW